MPAWDFPPTRSRVPVVRMPLQRRYSELTGAARLIACSASSQRKQCKTIGGGANTSGIACDKRSSSRIFQRDTPPMIGELRP